MTIVFKVSDNVKEKMIKYYKDLRRDKTPPYAIFQASDADTIITLYESGKVMFPEFCTLFNKKSSLYQIIIRVCDDFCFV